MCEMCRKTKPIFLQHFEAIATHQTGIAPHCGIDAKPVFWAKCLSNFALMKKGLIVLLIAGGVWYFSKQAQRIDIGGAALSRLKFDKGGIRLNIKIPVLNRSDISAKLEGFLGSLQYKGNILGNISLIQPIEIPRRSPAEPEFTTLLTLGSIAGELWTFLQNKVLKSGTADPKAAAVNIREFRVVGTLYVSGLAIDINEPLVD